MIKTILVPVLGDETDKPVYGTAVAAARVLGARLEFLFMGPSCPSFWEFQRAETSLRARFFRMFSWTWKGEPRTAEARLSFKSFCERERIGLHDMPPGPHANSAEWREEQGEPIAHVIGHMLYNDLLITRAGGERSGRVGKLNEAALARGGRCILMAPSRPPVGLNETVVIAWKETPEVARGAAAMPFVAGADWVVVLSINEGATTNVTSVGDVARQLRWHRLNVEAGVSRPLAAESSRHLSTLRMACAPVSS